MKMNNLDKTKKLFEDWNKCKTNKQLTKVSEKIAKTRFGTYGTISVLDVLAENIIHNNIMQREFTIFCQIAYFGFSQILKDEGDNRIKIYKETGDFQKALFS